MQTSNDIRLAGRVYVEFGSKVPHSTFWIHILHDVDIVPSKLIDELKKAGWKESVTLPPMYKAVDRYYSKKGSSIFNGFTTEERKTNMSRARRILRKSGFTSVEWRKLTLQDML